jgi:hypothetical protein
MLNEGNQIHNFISSSGSDFLTSYGSGSGSIRQKVTVPTVPVPVPFPVPVPQHWKIEGSPSGSGSASGSGSISQRHGSTGSGSTPKCHGSATLVKGTRGGVQEHGLRVRLCGLHGQGHQDVPELQVHRQQVLNGGGHHEQGRGPSCTGIFKQSMTRNGVGIGLSYRLARLHSLAELVPWNRFLGSFKV